MERNYLVYKVKQRQDANTVNFAIFVAYAQDVKQWVGIKRVGEVERGTQRRLKQTRVSAIKRFLQANSINTIPVSAILAFNPGSATFVSKSAEIGAVLPDIDINNGMANVGDWGVLTFQFDPASDEQNRPALIVDGQHRINGMSGMQQEQIPLVIAAFLDADHQEQAFQFVVINNKAQKVPTDNVKAIISDIDEEALQRRLLKAGVNYGRYPATLGDIDGLPDSPFYHKLDWPLNPDVDNIEIKVQLTTIETALKYIKSSLPILEEDDDSLKLIFIDIWKTISGYYPQLWNINSNFMGKVNILALNEFILDKIENNYTDGHLDIYDIDAVAAYIKNILESITPEYWTTEWVYPLQDNTVTRSRIKDDIRKISMNVRAGKNWNENLQNIAS